MTSFVQELVEQTINWIAQAPAILSFLMLVFCSFVEYVFPLFPGDTISIAGGFFAAKGALNPFMTFFALLFGGFLGTFTAWYIGTKIYQNKKFHNLFTKIFAQKELEKTYASIDKYGTILIAFNRFIPAIRGPLTIICGMMGISIKKVLLLGSFSVILWSGLLFFIGRYVAENLESMIQLLTTYSYVVLAIMALMLIFFAIKWSRKK